MGLGTAFAIYFIIWWVVLFTVLPFGVRSQAEEGTITPGSASGAPSRPQLGIKVGVTTVIAGAVFAVVYWLIVYRPIQLEDVPLPPW